jgi:hypothetical protein
MKIIDLDIFGKSPMNPPNSFSFPSLIVAIAPFHMVDGLATSSNVQHLH